MSQATNERAQRTACVRCDQLPEYSESGHRGFRGPTLYHDCPKATGTPTVVFTPPDWLGSNWQHAGAPDA